MAHVHNGQPHGGRGIPVAAWRLVSVTVFTARPRYLDYYCYISATKDNSFHYHVAHSPLKVTYKSPVADLNTDCKPQGPQISSQCLIKVKAKDKGLDIFTASRDLSNSWTWVASLHG